MKKFIMTALVCLSVVGIAGAAAGSSLAASAPAPKATGDIWFNNTGYGLDVPVPAHFVFNAIQSSPAKGNVSYSDQFGSYTGNVTTVAVSGNHATFTAAVTSTNYPGASLGETFTWTVYDNGQGSTATGADSFTWDGWALGDQSGSGSGPTQYPATAGNLQVSG